MGTELDSVLGELTQLLEKTGGTSRVRDGRVVPSVVYDLRYRVIVVSCVFERFARPMTVLPGRRWMRSDKLKFLQFVAIRPWLTSVVREWSEARRDAQRSMLTSDRLRRGFLADTTHDRLVDFLVAASVFTRHPNGTHVMEGRPGNLLDMLAGEVDEQNLFGSERAALADLRTITITTDMLEGW